MDLPEEVKGALWLWGSSRFHQLGEIAPGNVKAVLEPEAFPIDESVISVAMGDGHTLYATSDFEVFSTGRGREGQLGHGISGPNAAIPTSKRVESLLEENIVEVCCGALHSMCRTMDGKVFMWGLVHQDKDVNDAGAEGTADQAAAAGDARGMLGLGAGNETLRRIVKSSTERWLTATEDLGVDQIGIDTPQTNNGDGGLIINGERSADGGGEDYPDMMGERMAAADEGIVSMDAERSPVPTPLLAKSLSGTHVVSLAAGYGHNLALTNDGRVYSCGYNDRGQLGLGHRINCVEFQRVGDLTDVIQIACGQQHNIIRTKQGGVMVWGNGALGQLGLGRRVTGRRVPVRLQGGWEDDRVRIVDVAAGGNHSLAVSEDGSGWTWGHGEYGQHGATVSVSTNDLMDTFYHYEPRKITVKSDSTGEEVFFVQVRCGSCFSIGRTDTGDVYSWGWNSHGVLGHGRGYFSHAPMRVQKLGGLERQVVSIATGTNHCAAVVSDISGPLINFRYLLRDQSDCDVRISIEGQEKSFFAHRVILEARCRYFRGYLEAASQASELVTDEELGSRVLAITLLPTCATAITVKALLVYLYTDRLEVQTHNYRRMRNLAQLLYLPRLEALCTFRATPSKEKPEIVSTLHDDMSYLVNSSRLADVKILLGEYSQEDDDSASMICAHRCILKRFDYFRTLLSGSFKESSPKEGISYVDMAGLVRDEGIQLPTLQAVFQFFYTGSESVVPVDDPTAITELLVVAERFGIQKLVRICERHLIGFISLNDHENAAECATFASRYNLVRLARHCKGILKSSTKPS